MVFVVQISIVVDKHLIVVHLLYYRMAAALNINNTLCVNRRAHVIITLCYTGQRCQYIQMCDCLSCLLNTNDLLTDTVPDFTIEIILKGSKLIFRTKDHIFQLF